MPSNFGLAVCRGNERCATPTHTRCGARWPRSIFVNFWLHVFVRVRLDERKDLAHLEGLVLPVHCSFLLGAVHALTLSKLAIASNRKGAKIEQGLTRG